MDMTNSIQAKTKPYNFIPNSSIRICEQAQSKILTTPEKIVREFRLGAHSARLEYTKEKVSKFEWAVRIFLIFAFGWVFGYLHHFLTMAP